MPAISRTRKPQLRKRCKELEASQTQEERNELQKVLKASPPDGHLSALIALYTCDPVKLKKTFEQVNNSIKRGLNQKGTVYAFGSMVTGLSLKDSDIDLYLRVCDDLTMPHNQLCALIMSFLCETKKTNKFAEASRIPRTRTPIIRCKHRPTRIGIKIHFSYPNGAYNSEFIGDLMAHDKKLRDLTLFLKIWNSKVIGRNIMSNYCLISMIIVSLQVHGLLPSIQILQSGCLPDNFRGVNYSYNLELAPQIPGRINILDLIKNFFDLYSSIDFERKAVSPFFGCIMDKHSMLDIPEYTAQLLAMQAAGAETPSPFRMITCMYVQDSFDLHSNVAQAVNPFSLSIIKKCLSLASRATKDRRMRAQPEKLYEYLLLGLEDDLMVEQDKNS